MRKILLTLLTSLLCSVTAWGTTYTWDFSSNTETSYSNGASYSLLATDGATEMRYTAGSSDGLESTYLKENGKTSGASCKDIDGTTAIPKTRLIRLFVTGKGTLTISCTSNIGEYKIYQSNAAGTAASGSQIGSNYTGNGTAFGTSITVSGACIWIETATKGYITSITWTTGSSCAATAPGNISKGSACAGDALTLTSAGSPASGDTWYWQTSSTGTSTTNSGTTYDVSEAGTYYVRSYNTSGTCWSDAKSVTVAAGDWTSPTISGASSVTVGNTITLTGSPSGGTWASSDETKATVNSSTGVVTGEAAGSANITYTKDGCTSDNHAVTVSAVVCSPSISASPSSASYCKDDVATALYFTGSGHNAQKWQKSTDGGSSWSDIDGATNATYTPSTSSTGATQYRVVTTCDSYTTTATSSAATVTVKTSPGLNISLAP